MIRRSLRAAALAGLIAAAPLPVCGLGLTLGAGLAGEGVASAPPALAWKLQPAVGGRATAVLGIAPAFGLGVGLSLANAWPSGASGGYQIRGYSELDASAFAELAFPFTVMGARARAGADAGASASIATYSYTALSFFFPCADLAPFVSVRLPGVPWLELRTALPMRLILRRDLSWGFSAGLSLGAGWVMGEG
jgi:hypothetical protein